jgi:hypothetical protein
MWEVARTPCVQVLSLDRSAVAAVAAAGGGQPWPSRLSLACLPPLAAAGDVSWLGVGVRGDRILHGLDRLPPSAAALEAAVWRLARR